MSDTSPLPIPPASEAPAADPFLALLTDCESAAAGLSASVPALASLTADLVARSSESAKQALEEATSARPTLLARKARALRRAKRLSLKQCKRIAAEFEAADVSTEQLRVWAAVAGTVAACPDLDCAFAATPLLASPQPVQAPIVGLRGNTAALPIAGELGSVATGDGLRVVSAAGPGLEWFEPRSRNEFSVVLAQADGSVPAWLSSGDVTVAFRSAADNTPSGLHTAGPAVVTAAGNAGHGTVSVVYDGLTGDVSEVVLQLTVCGVVAADAAGDGAWGVCVPARPLAEHQCAAVGTHVRTLAVVASGGLGMAVSADEKWLVVGLRGEGTLSVYSLPRGALVRTFGGRGVGPLQFSGLYRLCFAPNGNLVVVDEGNSRLQEVTLEGVFVRFIGVGEFGDAQPFSGAVHDDVIAVGCAEGTGPRVVLFEFGTGTVTSRFGMVGRAPGQLSSSCTAIRFTPDGNRLIVAEHEAKRLSVFTTAGVFVVCVGAGVLGGGFKDVLQSVTGEYVVVDYQKCHVCVFSPDGSELVRSWGVRGTVDGQFENPSALAAAGQHLYVAGYNGGRLQLFE